MVVIVLIFLLAAAFALQLLTGGFPVEFFAFPLNVICLSIWVLALVWLWGKGRKSLLVNFMLSPLATLSSIVSVIIGALVIGLTGNASLASSWVMVFLLFYLQTVLVFVILRGFRAATPTGARLGPIRWRFILLHAGLLLTLASSFWGAPDGREYKVITYAGIILLLCGAFLLFLGGPTKRYRDTD